MRDEDIDALTDILYGIVDAPEQPPLPAEWPDAKTLCFQVGANTRNLPGYRLGMAVASIIDLAYEFAVIAHLADFLRHSEAGIAKLAAPAIEQLRDICLAEGARRGIMLSMGDDVDAISLAVQLMEEMIAAFTPGFVVSAGSRW